MHCRYALPIPLIPEINFLIFHGFLSIIGGVNLDRILGPTTISLAIQIRQY